ncbi:MAG: cell wall-active antibiotics response protein LiaF [Chloroflexi bacterium]|nr:cell wall-active antibiotics response protein LiaF [Chloroflexota bacterium]MDA1002871.1 cell wall-active antibiotics response protein LiaF [Chloroflexota bacterium]
MIGFSRLVEATDLPDFRWVAVLSVVLAVIGVALLVESRRGVNGGLVAVGIVLTAVLAVTTAIPSANWDSGFGDRTVRPTTAATLERSYDHAFGSMIVDLRDVPLPEGETRVSIGIAFGDVSVRVPSDVAVRVTGTTVFGSSSVLGRQHDGITSDIHEETDGYENAPRRLEIELSNAFGSATVR